MAIYGNKGENLKKLIFLVIFVFTAGAISAQELAFDEAINYAARAIEEDLPQKALVLVLNVKSPSEGFSNSLLNGITDQLVIGRKVSVVDRQNLDAIRAETDFQYSGEVSDASMVSIGRMLGAQYIVTGVTEESVNAYRIRFRSINIETTRIHSSIIIDIKKDAHVAFLIGGEEAVLEAERRQWELERSNKRANSRNNWLSAELFGYTQILGSIPFGFGISATYERMLNAHLSLGGNLYWATDYGKENQFGIDAVFRVYPTGKTFFLGVGLGYASFKGDERDRTRPDGTLDNFGNNYFFNGLTITPEIGWKVDIGKTGGFFMDFGVKASVGLGEGNLFGIRSLSENESPQLFQLAYMRLFFGMGYAF